MYMGARPRRAARYLDTSPRFWLVGLRVQVSPIWFACRIDSHCLGSPGAACGETLDFRCDPEADRFAQHQAGLRVQHW